jgi:hypothetical protein
MQRHIGRSIFVRLHMLDQVCLEDGVYAPARERGEAANLEKCGSIG